MCKDMYLVLLNNAATLHIKSVCAIEVGIVGLVGLVGGGDIDCISDICVVGGIDGIETETDRTQVL